MDINAVIARVIAEKMDIPEEDIIPEKTLEDLKIDSLDMVEIIMDLEEELDVNLEDMTDVKNIGDVIGYIEAQKK